MGGASPPDRLLETFDVYLLGRPCVINRNLLRHSWLVEHADLTGRLETSAETDINVVAFGRPPPVVSHPVTIVVVIVIKGGTILDYIVRVAGNQARVGA